MAAATGRWTLALGCIAAVLACGEHGSSLQNAGPADGGEDGGILDGGLPLDAGAGDAGPLLGVPPVGKAYHGVFPAVVPDGGGVLPDSDASMDALDAYQAAVGRPLAWVYFTNEWYVTKSFPGVTAGDIRSRGAVPFIRLHMRSQQRQLVTDPTYTLDRIVSGEFDADLRAWADGAKAFATPLVVQYGTEVNGDWNPWSAKYNGGLAVGPAKFRAAFRHIVQVMRAEGADNITWALHLNGENWPADDLRNNAGAYYPGDDVVDWIGFSFYGNYGVSDPVCRVVAAMLQGREAELGDAVNRKPVFFFELGISATATQCDPTGWTRTVLEDLLGGTWPEVRGFSWWDETEADHSFEMAVPGDPRLEQPFHDVLNGPLAPALVDRPLVP